MEEGWSEPTWGEPTSAPASLGPGEPLAPASLGASFWDAQCLIGTSAEEATAEIRGLAGDAAEIEDKAFSDCRYLTCKAVGLQVRLKPAVGGAVDVVFLYNDSENPDDGFRQFTAGPLPEGLSWSCTGRHVVARLGEPSDKWGGGKLNIGIGYEIQGLDVTFRSYSWEDFSSLMSFVSVYEGLDPAFDLCALCGKTSRFHCGRCKKRRYCSSKCQKEHWPKHQPECVLAPVAGPFDGKAAAPPPEPAWRTELRQHVNERLASQDEADAADEAAMVAAAAFGGFGDLVDAAAAPALAPAPAPGAGLESMD